uniref:Interleukin-17C-like n=1 Tax=Gouania willdenowi TaxID=441366 RepID=A0A8C5D4N8_GOUWI
STGHAQLTDQKFRSHYPQPHEPPVAPNPGHCPVEWFSQSPRDTSTSNRSLSPWIYESKQMADHFPFTYVQAKCLCDGCIQFNKDGPFQNHIFNSVAVYQSRIFLKREPCKYNSTYRLTPVAENVAVACTCVNPKRVS